MIAKDKFFETIEEVSYLNDLSKKEHSSSKDIIFYKVIILLLCAKIETFVKGSSNEYIDLLISKKLSVSQIPESLKIEIINNEINKINNDGINKYIMTVNNHKRAELLSMIWNPNYKLEKLFDSFSLSISNNGTNAFEDCYKKIGFPKIITDMISYERVDSIGEIETITSHSIKDTINSIISMRHNIIHDDATPTITESDIDLFIAICKDFVIKIDNFLISNLNSLV